MLVGDAHRGVLAYSREDGRALWAGDLHRTTSGFAAAPYAPQVIVMHYAFDAAGPGALRGVFGLDATTGKRLWRLDLPAPRPAGFEQYTRSSPSQIRVWWLDAETFLLVTPASKVHDGTLLDHIEAQRYRLVEANPVADGAPVVFAPNCRSTWDCQILPLRDGRIVLMRDGRYVELNAAGTLLSEFVTGASGAARRFADGRLACEGDCAGVPRE